jgi:serine/threonine protein phosphatase PrpC
MSPYKLEAGTAQHVGDRPQQNDRTALFQGARAPGFVMAVVADGYMEGAAAEQVLLTAKQLFDEFKPADNPSVARIDAMLRNIVAETHMISKMNGVRSQSQPTSSAALLVLTPERRAVWAHVGDCRVYRIKAGQCAERSNDAAYIEHLVKVENLPLEAAKGHRRAVLLNNVIGNENREPFVTSGSYDGVQAGDAFLLCSDGVWHYFTDAEFAAVCSKNTPRQAAEMLVKKGGERANGKADNMSMAIIRLVEPPKEDANYTVKKMGKAV